MTQSTEMSVTQYPDSINPPDLQIWNNAAFDPLKENLTPNALQSSVPIGNSNNGKGESGVRDEKKVDSEIEEIENQLSRLSAKLEALRMEKIVKSTVERRSRVVPQSKPHRRGLSLGPAEIVTRSRQMGKPEITPLQPIQNRRKSCSWKLQEIDEKKIATERGHKTVSKVQAVTTLGSRKLSNKEECILAAIQPKKLFKDGDKSVTAKNGRVVPSRYSQISVVSDRKRSLPDDGNEDAKRSDKRHAKFWGSELRAKKKWEIPSDLVVYKGAGENLTVSKQSIAAKVVDMLPRIRTNNLCVNDSSRDSGAAKRVAELMGRRFLFCPEEEEASVCQALTFVEEE